MSLPYVLAQGILVGKVMPDDKTNWKVLIPYTCQFLIGNVRRRRKNMSLNVTNTYGTYQFLIGNVRRSAPRLTLSLKDRKVSIPHR